MAKDKSELKTKMVGIKVSPDEKKMIEDTAKAEGFNVSQFVLWLVRKFRSSKK